MGPDWDEGSFTTIPNPKVHGNYMEKKYTMSIQYIQATEAQSTPPLNIISLLNFRGKDQK